jgi:hypothetical protein
LAFYKGDGSAVDRAIRLVTRSQFSHVEFVPSIANGLAISASGRDGGVRQKRIDFDQSRWEFLAVPWAPADALDRLRSELGKPYDFPGLIGSQLLNLRRQSVGRWFCSEICAYSLGMGMPHQYAPGDLYRAVFERNTIYAKGLAECLNTKQS